jgi:thiamine pyrophosphate-dependent acetolactate synthase large subunit-like protein
VVDCYIPNHIPRETEFAGSDPDTLEEALLDLERALRHAKHPLIYIDRDVIAHQAEDLLLHFAETWHIPVTCSNLAKSYSIEAHPNCLGDLTAELSRRSDLLLLFGYAESPIYTSEHQILFSSSTVTIAHKRYPNLFLKEVILSLCSLEPNRRQKIWQTRDRPETLRNDVILVATHPELIEKIKKYILGDQISTSYSANSNYSLAAGLGACKARPYKRTIVLLDQKELEASLTELYLANQEGIPLIICVDGDTSDVASLFPNLRVMEAGRKGFMQALNTPELILLELK